MSLSAVGAEMVSSSASSVPTPGALLFGINSLKNHPSTWLPKKVAYDRSNELDIAYTKTPAEAVAAVTAWKAVAGITGATPIVIVNTTDGEVLGKITAATYAANAVAIIKAINTAFPTVTIFQIINEPYYKGSTPTHGAKVGSNGTVYAAILKATYEKAVEEAILPACVLLPEAFGVYHYFNTLVAEEKQEPSEGPPVFKKWIKDIFEAMKDPPKMSIGDSATTYAVGDSTTVGREEAFQFTATKTQTLTELQFRTNATPNAGVTSLKLGILAENAGKPGAVLGQGEVNGTEGAEKTIAINSWIAVTGLSIAVVAGTKYWLTVLPKGVAAKKLFFNAAVASAGTGNQESTATGLATITEEPTWETFNQGPVGFRGGIELNAPTLMSRIAGWSNHPYGTLGAADGEENFNWGSTETHRTEVSNLGMGGANNWWLTEFGWITDEVQKERMQGFLEKAQAAHNAGWLTAIFAYSDTDGGWTLFGKTAGGTYAAFAETYG